MTILGRSLFTIIILLFSVTAFKPSSAAERGIYLFQSDAKFIKIDTEQGQITDVGNLWYLDIDQVSGVLQGGYDDQLFITTGVKSLINKQQREFSGLPQVAYKFPADNGNPDGIVTIRSTSGGSNFYSSLTPFTMFNPPGNSYEQYELTGTKIFNHEGGNIFIGWRDKKTEKPLTSINSLASMTETARVIGFPVTEETRMCENEFLVFIYTPVTGERIYIYDFATEMTSTVTLEEIGSTTGVPSPGVITAGGCRVLINGASSVGDDGLFIYDLTTKRATPLTKINHSPSSTYTFINKGKHLLVGSNINGKGSLTFYDLDGGKTAVQLDITPGGRIIGESPDGVQNYYYAPGKLAVIDVKKFEIKHVIDVPFKLTTYIGYYKDGDVDKRR